MMNTLWKYVLLSLFSILSSAVPLAPVALNALVKSGFKGNIIVDGHPGFSNATEPWSLNYAKNPRLALLPVSPEDVSLAIKWLNDNSLDFAVRSGGVADSQSNDVILNLALLNKVDFDPSAKVVRLGPGQQSGDVYNALKSSSIAVLGGRIPLVGIGGFTLGGGISYLMNHYGLASDSLVDAQVVLADGSIVWASQDPDLMFAVKGAGYTIGAVTELVVKAYPKPTTIFSGFKAFPINQFETIKQNVVNLTISNTDPNVSLLLAIIALNGAPIVLVNPIIYGNESFAKASLPWLWEIPGAILDNTGMVTWEELQDLELQFVSHPASNSNYQQHNVIVHNLTSEVMQAAVDWQLPLLSDPRWAGIQILFEPFMPGAFSSHATAGAWPHSSPNMGIVEIFIEQVNATVDDAAVNVNQLRAGGALVEQAGRQTVCSASLSKLRASRDPRL